MIVPANRLVIWSSVMIPVALLGGVVQSATFLALGIFGIALFLAIADALWSLKCAALFKVNLPEVIRLAVDRTGRISVVLERDNLHVCGVKIAFSVSPDVGFAQDEWEILFPEKEKSCMASLECRPVVRGRYELTVCHMETNSAFGLWDVRWILPVKSEIRVYPSLVGERRTLAALFLNRDNAGSHARRMLGQGREFERLREYVRGDSYQDIHWKATARRGRPITKLFQVEKTQEIYAVMDTSRLSGRMLGRGAVLDQYLRSALVLGHAAQRQGDQFGLLTFGSRIHRFLRASSGKAHFTLCYDTLYTAMPELESPEYGELLSYLRTRLRRRSLLVIMTDLSDAVQAESFLRHVDLISHNHLVLVTMIQPPGVAPVFVNPLDDDPDAVYRALAGHFAWQGLAELGRNLYRRGVGFAMAESGQLSSELVTRYMHIKERQLL
jgi:uncharacterized protein (DUF58 family)